MTHEPIETLRGDRRRLLKAGAAAAGGAFVVPQILNTTAAGAQTETCYRFAEVITPTLGGENQDCTDISGIQNLNGNGPLCPGFVTALNGVVAGLPSVLDECPPAPLDFSPLTRAGGTIELPAGCRFEFAGIALAQLFGQPNIACAWAGGDQTAGSASIGPENTASFSISNIADNVVTAFVFVVCCTGSALV